jgi:HAD superfamily hydrolase (TIGR01509 family)
LTSAACWSIWVVSMRCWVGWDRQRRGSTLADVAALAVRARLRDRSQRADGIRRRHPLAELKLDIAPERFLESFAAWPTQAYPGALELVASIPERYQLALLSNSNVLHWPRVLDEMKLRSSFEHRFSSHLIGKIKPDAEAFEHVIDRLNCQPAEVLFLDDNLLNVEAARSVGMQAQRVRGVQESRIVLQAAGVLPPGAGQPS